MKRPAKPPPPTIDEWSSTWAALRPDLSPTTLANYAGTFGLLAEFVGGDTRVSDVTKRMADDWRVWLSTPSRGVDGRSAYTVSSHLARARAAWSMAVTRGDAESNPFDGITVRTPDMDHDWAEMSRDDLRRLLDVCDPPWRRLFALCRLAGLRRGEALRLKWSDVDLVNGVLSVRCEKATTKRRSRRVPIEPDLSAILAADVGRPNALVCRVNPHNLHDQAVAIIEKAGLKKYEKPFHTLRKNVESEWMARYPVMSVCQWLGHSPAVASRYYVRTSVETMSLVTGIKP